jgi:hypothetical protein
VAKASGARLSSAESEELKRLCKSSLIRVWTGDRLHRIRQEAMAGVREYVGVFYNSKRLHSTLGCKTSVDYE